MTLQPALISLPSVNFINILHAAFAHVEPESVKETIKSSVFRDMRAQKLRVNILVKLTPRQQDPHLVCIHVDFKRFIKGAFTHPVSACGF